MSGDNVSLTSAKQRFDKKQQDMSDYEKRIGLPSLPAEKTECEYLDLSGEEINRLNPEKCGEIASELASYGIYIQRVLSREKGILRWLDSRIELSIAGELNSYQGYYSHVQRRAIAIINNAYAKELEEMKINSQLKVDMLDGLTYQINQLCRVLLDSQTTKRQQKNY